MYRPSYGPLATLSTGASGPKPSIPSCTIVPAVIATSVTCEPQSALTVGMSTPWSRLQSLEGCTVERGRSGNTNEFDAPAVGALGVLSTPSFPGFLTAASSFAAVRRPTLPLAGQRRYAR